MAKGISNDAVRGAEKSAEAIVALDGRRAELAVVSRLRSRIRRAGKVTRETAETWRQKAAKWSAEIWAQGVKADAERRRTQEHVER